MTVQEIHRKDANGQVRRLADLLGWHISRNTHFGPADHVGPCDEEQKGWAGNAVLSQFPITARVTVPLSPESQDCPVKRSMAGVKLSLGGGRYVHVFASHFTPRTSQKNVDFQQAQARKVLNYLDHGGPLLFTGDLNARPQDKVPRWFVNAGLVDTGARHANSPTHGSNRIDYIDAKRVTVTSGYVIATSLSDHRPVVMNIRVS